MMSSAMWFIITFFILHCDQSFSAHSNGILPTTIAIQSDMFLTATSTNHENLYPGKNNSIETPVTQPNNSTTKSKDFPQINKTEILNNLKPSKGHVCYYNATEIMPLLNQTTCQCIADLHIDMIQNGTCQCRQVFHTWYNFSCRCNESLFVIKITNSSCISTSAHTQILPQKKMHMLWESIQFICNFILLVVGVTGNVLVALTIVKTKAMQNLQNYFVFSLALTDLMTLVLIMPLNLVKKHLSWPFGEFVCSYIFPLADVLPAVSILTLVSISIDRYRAICYSLSHAHSLGVGVSLIVVIWILSYLIVGLPFGFVLKVTKGYWAATSCDPIWPNATFKKTYYMIRMFLSFVYPSLVIYLCYVKVNGVLGRNLTFLARSASGLAQAVRLKRQRRVMSMFFAIFLTFFICFLPLNVLLSLYAFDVMEALTWKYFGECFQMATIFAFTNSACNPVILYRLSRGYRESFRGYLPFLRSRQSTQTRKPHDDNEPGHSNRLAARRSTKDSNVSFLASSPRFGLRGGPKEAIEMNEEHKNLYVPSSPSVRSSYIPPSPTHLN